MQQQSPPEQFDLAGMVADLNGLLRLKTTVIGMKLFATVEEMTAISKIRRPSAIHTTDQIVSMASRLGWTVGITAEDLVGAQCRAVIGLAPQDDQWRAGANYVGVWHENAEDARKRQEALDVVPHGRYEALVVSPLASGRRSTPSEHVSLRSALRGSAARPSASRPATAPSSTSWTRIQRRPRRVRRRRCWATRSSSTA